MSHDLSLDLRVARQQAGLSQRDAAHLLAIHPNRLSRIEKHGAPPKLREAVQLSLVYKREFRSLFALEFEASLAALEQTLSTLPDPTNPDDPAAFNRLYTLSALAERISAFNERRHGG